MLMSANNKTASDLLDKAQERLAMCQENISAWNAKYGGQGKIVTPAAKAELDAVMENCNNDIKSAQENIY